MANINSPLVEALLEFEADCAAELRVHISKNPFEKNLHKKAQHIFRDYKLDNSSNTDVLLFYINIYKKKFIIIGGSTIKKTLGERELKSFIDHLTERLMSTFYERALAQSIREFKSFFLSNNQK